MRDDTVRKESPSRASIAAPGAVMDRRVRKTRSALTDALVKLMAIKPFKSITVKELTDLADVNRATFYVHYKDIYDMLDQTKQDVRNMASHLIEVHSEELSHGQYVGFNRDLFDYFDKHGALYSLLLGENGDSSFLESTLRMMRERFFALGVFTSREVGSPEARKSVEIYEFAYACGGLGSLIKHWLSKKDGRESVDTMARIASEFMTNTDEKLFERTVSIIDSTQGTPASA